MATHATPFVVFEFKPEQNAVHATWKDTTAMATEDQIKESMLEYVKFIDTYRAPNLLVNEKDMKFEFSPSFQAWMDENVSEKARNMGSVRFAFIKSEDFIIGLAAEMVMEQVASNAPVRFFDNAQEAEAWLIS
ncbi:hypothetical protein SAMN05421780_11164 [Flexibacter flexilis DSM 6793]|uniref:SpoIIAA-like n=1 Tax=Flexibacter flexilis DSM 6793 TaxID=927664 RepID=A0A1I1MQY5_9BACT|nr:STAS/SEC14 domain-containing protein [Flexibacter flexilis]SFC87884.1 hypothetical protein SAMN05421780_11164 [Flexibacter flexilis DSM 6793]